MDASVDLFDWQPRFPVLVVFGHEVDGLPADIVQRCETRYQDDWEERVDGYRVTYQYQGRRQVTVTELPYRPGDRIRVRVAVTPADS